MEILSLIIAFLVAALVIWIVGKLNLGMSVEGYVPAMIAAVAIAIIAWLISFLFGWLIPNWTGWMGAIVNLLVAAVVHFAKRQIRPRHEGQRFRRGNCGRHLDRRRGLVGQLGRCPFSGWPIPAT